MDLKQLVCKIFIINLEFYTNKIIKIMKPLKFIICISLLISQITKAQEIIPLDTTNFKIQAKSYVLEPYKGKNAIYLQSGAINLKNMQFLNGIIEFDIFLKDQRGFPGINFRANGNDSEEWYMRPHQDGNPDANQATAVIKGVTPWQLHFGPKYSFPYQYNYKDWTHVKLIVSDDKAQVFLDHSEKPNLSWKLFHTPKAGEINIRSGGATGLYIANVSVDTKAINMIDYKPIEREIIEGLIPAWEISNKFEEKLLNNPSSIDSIISTRKWQGKIEVEEGTAAIISRKDLLFDGKPGNTVFAKVEIKSNKNQLKMLEFGYSDRVVVILNGQPLYRGNNNFRSRDYRYLGTVGLFDGVYLNLKKGKNTLLLAVSENFGGWLVTGRIGAKQGISIK